MSPNPGYHSIIVLKEEESATIYFKVLSSDEVTKIRDGLVRYAQYGKNASKQLELNTELLKTYPFSYANIIAIGDTDLSHSMATRLIDSVEIKLNDYSGPSYKCFENLSQWRSQHKFCNFAVHLDPLSSWNCAMMYCNHPKYGIIYRITHEKRSS